MDMLSILGIKKVNSGACFGPNGWLASNDPNPLCVIDPTTEKTIAHVHRCSATAYKTIVSQAKSAFLAWREIPAPERGTIIRQMGNALREKKIPLSQLIT